MRGEALITVVASLVLIACGHQPPVQDMGNGQHSLSATSSAGGYYGSREEAVEQANDYCAHSGQRAVTAGFYDKTPVGPNGEHTTSIIFTCTTPKGRM
jgi:hypothetical protein